MPLSFCRFSLIVLVFVVPITNVNGQKVIDQDFQKEEYTGLLDSLSGSVTELATQLAVLHYPKLKGNKIKIKYKNNVTYPITASWSFWNVFKLKRWHTYVLLIKPGTFVDQVSLNKRVGIFGHEMAHFEYYRKRPAIAMVWWGIKYVSSKKFRYSFEKDADRTAIDRGLGYQLMDLSFYISRQEVINHMKSNTAVYGEGQ